MENKHSHRYEARHAAPKEAKYSVRQRLTAAAMVLTSATAVGGGMYQRQEDARQAVAAVAEKYMESTVDTLHASVDPEYTIILPFQTKEGEPLDVSWKLADEKEMKAKGNWCNTPNVPLYQYANPEQMEAAASIEMGLSVSAYEAIADEIYETTDKGQVEAIVERVYRKLGVQATFNETRSGLEATNNPQPIDNGDPEGVRSFRTNMVEQLEALTYMPKAMVKLPKSIDFVEADSLAYYTMEGDKKVRKGVDGLYDSGEDQIIIRVGSEAWVTVHEFAHAVEHDACPGVPGTNTIADRELEEVHTIAKGRAERDKDAINIKADWPTNPDGFYKRFYNSYRWQTGFPTEYAQTVPGEFFADETAALLMKGQLNVYDKERTPVQVPALQQLVVERLAEAMPGVDFRSLVAARTEATAQAQEHDVPLQALITNHVSQFDRTFVSTYNKLVAGDEVKPALKLVNPDGESATYIFCKQSDLRMTAEGALGGEYSIQLGRLEDTTFDTMLQDTALKYLMDLAKEKGIKLKYEVRKANEGTYIMASVPDEVLTDTEPLVRYIDITTREETGTGG